MNLKSELYVVYHDRINKTQGKDFGVPSGPLFLYIYGAWYQGKNLTRNKIAKKYADFFGVQIQEEGEFFGPFNSEEELKKFMYLLGEELGAPSIKFLSLRELSELIKKASCVGSLQSSISNSSESLKNLDSKEARETLISKIFNKNK